MSFVTYDEQANEQLLYFTSNSVTPDCGFLFYLSDADGQPNIWAQRLKDGKRWRISDNREGALKSYVYFQGRPYQGLGKASVSLDGPRKRVYYIQGDALCAAGVEQPAKVLATLPDGQVTAFTHVSADGRYVCVPTTDERALESDVPLPVTADGCGKLAHNIDARVQAENCAPRSMCGIRAPGKRC